MMAKFKEWVLEVLRLAITGSVWVENSFGGKPGTEKKKILVNMLVDVIDKLPYTPRWVVHGIVSWIADKAVERLNIATSHNFAGLELSPAAVKSMAVAATTKELEVELSWEQRYQQLVNEYIKDGDNPETIVPILPTEPEPEAEQKPKRSQFDDCMAFVKLAEGGANFNVVNGKPVLKPGVYDTGGATIYGITGGALKTAFMGGIVPHCDITQLTHEQAVAIYRANYWDKYDWDGLPYPISLICFDAVVNGGLGWTTQDALNEMGEQLVRDGLYGKKTKEALFRVANSTLGGRERLARELLASRVEYYDVVIQKNPAQLANRKGWHNRIRNLSKECGVKSPV